MRLEPARADPVPSRFEGMSFSSVLERAKRAVSGGFFLLEAHPVGPNDVPTPVYWANDLFFRRAISMASDMAESGRTPDPRTSRHGHSRPPLSAALRTVDSSRQARLANLLGSTAPASPRAAIYVAHSSKRSRSDPDDAAARNHCGRKGLRAASRRMDRRASRTVAKGGAVSSRHNRAVARCSPQDCASRGSARHCVDRNTRQRRADLVRGRLSRAHRAAGGGLFLTRKGG